MKKVISIVFILMLSGSLAFAQRGQHGDKKKGDDWREKVRAEQVAFITTELDLSEAEAQAFWPVYNDVQKQRREAYKATHEAFMALAEGVEGDDAAALLDNYVDAKRKCEQIENESLGRYKAVLPVKKVALLMMAEEKFRHQQIGRLQQGGPGPGPGDPRPEGRGQRGGWQAPVTEN